MQYIAYQGKEVGVAIFEAGAIGLNVGVVGHAQICASILSWVMGSLLKIQIRLSGCQFKSGQHASPCLDVYKKISDTYQLIRQQLFEVWCTAGKVSGDQIAIKSLGRDHGGVIAVVVIAVLVAR